MNDTAKRITIISTVLLCLLSILSITFYAIITFLLPEKITDDTVYSNALKNVTDENEQFVLNVNYYTNENNNGVKLFEVKINNYIDTDTATTDNPVVYSKGVQFVGDVDCSFTSPKFTSYGVLSSTFLSWYEVKSKNATCYYDTQNNVSARSTVKLDDDSQFRISIGDDVYLMAFYGTDTYKTVNYPFWTKIYQEKYDLSYLIGSLYNIADSVDFGSGQITQDFGKLFKFKKFENGAYGGEWLSSETVMNGKLQKNFYDYFTINLHKYKDGATKASDSLFKIINYNANFEIVDKSKADDYFNGSQIIVLIEKNFVFTLVDSSAKKYKLELSENTKKYLDEHPNNAVSVALDTEKLSALGIETFDVSIDSRYSDRVKVGD